MFAENTRIDLFRVCVSGGKKACLESAHKKDPLGLLMKQRKNVLRKLKTHVGGKKLFARIIFSINILLGVFEVNAFCKALRLCLLGSHYAVGWRGFEPVWNRWFLCGRFKRNLENAWLKCEPVQRRQFLSNRFNCISRYCRMVQSLKILPLEFNYYLWLFDWSLNRFKSEIFFREGSIVFNCWNHDWNGLKFKIFVDVVQSTSRNKFSIESIPRLSRRFKTYFPILDCHLKFKVYQWRSKFVVEVQSPFAKVISRSFDVQLQVSQFSKTASQSKYFNSTRNFLFCIAIWRFKFNSKAASSLTCSKSVCEWRKLNNLFPTPFSVNWCIPKTLINHVIHKTPHYGRFHKSNGTVLLSRFVPHSLAYTSLREAIFPTSKCIIFWSASIWTSERGNFGFGRQKKNCWKSCHTASVQFVICIHISSEYKSSTRRDYYSQPSAARFQMSIFIMIFETEKLPNESSEMFHPQLHFLLRKFPPCLSPASVPFPFLPFSVNNFFSGAILDFSLALFRIKLSRLSEKQL